MKSGRRPLAAIAQQRELTDDQHRPRHVGQGKIHFFLTVLENSQSRDLFGQLSGVGLRIVGSHAQQHQHAGADAAADFTGHSDRRRTNALNTWRA